MLVSKHSVLPHSMAFNQALSGLKPLWAAGHNSVEGAPVRAMQSRSLGQLLNENFEQSSGKQIRPKESKATYKHLKENILLRLHLNYFLQLS